MTALLLLAAAAAATPAHDIPLGRWQTETKHGVVEISRCGASICGKLLTSDGIRANPTLADQKNANASLRTRPLRGMTMLWGFSRSADGWTGGNIYNADDGRTYSADVLTVNANTIKVRGCVFKPLCKTQTWRRIP